MIIVLVLLMVLCCASYTQAQVSFVAGGAASAATMTLPTHVAGDVITMIAVRADTTIPTVPAGWTTLDSSTVTGLSSVYAYKVAASNAETSGTWTNATRLVSTVYRGVGSGSIGAAVKTTGSGTTLTYGAVTLAVTNGTSWVVASATHANAVSTGAQVAPTGMTNRAESGATTPRTGMHDTNGGVSSWSSQNVAMSGSGAWVSYTLELPMQVTGSSGGCLQMLLGVGRC